MDAVEETIFDEYVYNYRVEAESYKMMGKMLDENLVKERLNFYEIFNIYIYGGSYLAAQLCRSIGNNANIKGIVDKNGRCAAKVSVPVVSLREFEKLYIDENIIITPPKFYKEIKTDLLHFINEDKILFLGEFLEGFC